MNLHEWAVRWSIPYDALYDLQRQMGIADDSVPDLAGPSEAAVSARVRLDESKRHGRLWRNNSGAGYMQDGSFIRWGLANESQAMNERIKSSDLIGLRPVTIAPGDVGRRFGLFVAREVKAGNWRFTGTPRETAQLKFIELVVSLGGDASFTTGA